MTGRRTTLVRTLDRAIVDLPEPSWCLGHTQRPAELFVDVSHRGAVLPLGLPGEPVLTAHLVQFPNGSGPRAVGLFVEAELEDRTHGPDELDRLAAGLVEAAAQLRGLARQLDTLRVVESGGER